MGWLKRSRPPFLKLLQQNQWPYGKGKRKSLSFAIIRFNHGFQEFHLFPIRYQNCFECLNYIHLLLIQNNSSGFFEHFKYVKIRLRVWFKQSEAGEFQLKPKLSLCSHNAQDLRHNNRTEQHERIPICKQPVKIRPFLAKTPRELQGNHLKLGVAMYKTERQEPVHSNQAPFQPQANYAAGAHHGHLMKCGIIGSGARSDGGWGGRGTHDHPTTGGGRGVLLHTRNLAFENNNNDNTTNNKQSSFPLMKT